MKEKILSIVMNCCDQHNQVSEDSIDLELDSKAPLYGTRGPLNSLALVSLIVAIEQAIEEELGVLVTLADAKAASQENSPFRDVGSLVSYAQMRVEEENKANE